MSKCRSALVVLLAGVVAGLAAAQLKAEPKAKSAAQAQPVPAPPKLGIGRTATADEIAGWDIDIRPDGHGLPVGKGTVKQGEPLYLERCAGCHGEFGESAGRWPILMGGAGTLASHDPVKSVGSYWPYASTLIDYIRRSMPFGNAQSLSNDELYAVTAYVLFLNDVIKDENFELDQSNFSSIKLPNQPNFLEDDREVAEKEFWRKEPCMAHCLPGEARIIGRARAIDVTPETKEAPKVE
jgi:S-disulfanyl-L-cysteine oxidoreductase SoxD